MKKSLNLLIKKFNAFVVKKQIHVDNVVQF
jgi:hypothetical protein